MNEHSYVLYNVLATVPFLYRCRNLQITANKINDIGIVPNENNMVRCCTDVELKNRY